jgi:cyclopropane-fatty-acyl-phospholipid synthase
MSTIPVASQTASTRVGFLDRLARRVVTKQLAGLRRGEITVCDTSNTITLGEPADLRATLRVNHPKFFRHAVLGGTLSVAESYLNGDWECDDLTSLFRIFVRNRNSASKLDGGLAKLASYGHRLFHWWQANTRRGSRRNIGAHYDLGNDFFGLWLDDTMAYSSGIFPAPGASLREASVEKFDRVCRKLNLRPSDEVLEIGTGWCGFAIHAAKNYGCHVTTTTISREQIDVAEQRIKEAGLASQVMLLQQDYRDLSGQFDKLVSIEMIEAVGYQFLDDFFQQCNRLLRPDGSLVLQAIVMPERGYGQYLKSVDFIQRYIFPGGCLPSLGAILASIDRATDLRFVHAEDFAPHYAETLRRWRQSFHMRLDDVRRLGYSEQFIRLWNYYLCYCEAAFEERHVGVLQIQFDKPQCRRDLITQGENRPAQQGRAETTRPIARPSRERSLCEK